VFDYRAALSRVIDGDSAVLLIDVGFGARVEEEIRLLGVSAPERYQPGGLECRDFVAAWFKQLPQTRRWPLEVRTTPNTTLEPLERRTFVRFLATVSDITDPDNCLNAALAVFLSQHPEWGHGI
jgi:endonuclease YncB( thermonuclease family)